MFCIVLYFLAASTSPQKYSRVYDVHIHAHLYSLMLSLSLSFSHTYPVVALVVFFLTNPHIHTQILTPMLYTQKWEHTRPLSLVHSLTLQLSFSKTHTPVFFVCKSNKVSVVPTSLSFYFLLLACPSCLSECWLKAVPWLSLRNAFCLTKH